MGRGSRTDIVGRLGSVGNGSRRNQVGVDGGKEYWERQLELVAFRGKESKRGTLDKTSNKGGYGECGMGIRMHDP